MIVIERGEQGPVTGAEKGGRHSTYNESLDMAEKNENTAAEGKTDINKRKETEKSDKEPLTKYRCQPRCVCAGDSDTNTHCAVI